MASSDASGRVYRFPLLSLDSRFTFAAERCYQIIDALSDERLGWHSAAKCHDIHNYVNRISFDIGYRPTVSDSDLLSSCELLGGKKAMEVVDFIDIFEFFYK